MRKGAGCRFRHKLHVCDTVHAFFDASQAQQLDFTAVAVRVNRTGRLSLDRLPETMARNIDALASTMGLPRPAAVRLLCCYPAALDMAPATVADHLKQLQQLMGLQQDDAVAMVVRCGVLSCGSPANFGVLALAPRRAASHVPA